MMSKIIEEDDEMVYSNPPQLRMEDFINIEGVKKWFTNGSTEKDNMETQGYVRPKTSDIDNINIYWTGDTGNLMYTDPVPGDYNKWVEMDTWIYPQVRDYYYHTHFGYESKVDQAFKILKALQDKKVIDVKKVKTFIDLVNLISKELYDGG